MKFIRIVRNVDFDFLFDSFFISAIATVLITRFYLEITGFPQIGGSALHISHLLPGSLLMLVAILLMLAAVNRSVREFSAVVGGIGFGLVWDELGKFITQDNNYFFQPTLGLIYLTFVAMYLISRYFGQKHLTQDDYIANAIDLLKEAAIKDLDPREYEYAKDLLSRVSSEHPLYEPVMNLFEKIGPSGKREPLFIDRAITLAKSPLVWLSKWGHFTKIVLTVSILYGLGSIVIGVLFFYGLVDNDHKLETSDIVGGISVLATALYTAIGCYYYLRGQRKLSYRLFELALLIAIFVGQVILFFKNASLAVVGLLITLVLLINVRMLISEEHHSQVKVKKL